MTHYVKLGVALTATPDDIKKAFRQLAKQHHPDTGGDIIKFQQISEAYEVLSDPNKKAYYDHTLNQQTNPFINEHFEFNFNMNSNDIFRSFREKFVQRNANIRLVLEIPFLDTLDDHIKFVTVNLSNGVEHLEIKIPSAIEDGALLTLRGRGDNAYNNMPRGNLEIITKIISHEKFYRQGIDIVTSIDVNCFTAAVGGNVELITPQNKSIELKIPPGTQHNQIFGITDLGFKNVRNIRGNLLIKIKIVVPKNLTDMQKDLIRQAEIQ
jgi:curved DNA-binding protein